jgi:hypothetical protein
MDSVGRGFNPDPLESRKWLANYEIAARLAEYIFYFVKDIAFLNDLIVLADFG